MGSRAFVHNKEPERRFFAFDMFETLVTNKKNTVLPIFDVLCTYYPNEKPEHVSHVYHELTKSFKISHHNEELPINAIVDHLDLAFGCKNNAWEMEEPLLLETDLYVLAEGADSALEYLKDNGYKIGVLSNTRYHSRTLRKMLEICGISQYVDEVVASADIGHRKPDARSYDEILKRLGADAKDCYFCGDNIDKDYFGPLSAGLKAAVLIDPEHKKEVHGRIDYICDLPKLFDENTSKSY